MRCPFCHSDDTQVMDTRVSDEGDSVRRRRRCASCDKRFTTYERAELSLPAIVKKNGSPEYIIIDEVQDIIKWELFIRSKYSEKKYHIILS